MATGIFEPISQLGYNLGLGGFGLSEPVGTPYNPNQTPQSVYNMPSSTASGFNSPSTTSGGGGGSYSNYNVPVPTGRPQVLGISTGPAQSSAPTTSAPAPTQQTFDPYAALRNQISGGWDSYIGQLNDILNNGLPTQQNAQNNIVNSQYQQGVDTANQQKAASLKDIASTIRNAFQAGNNYLGARGAGDSSANQMYSYALNQEAMKQNSDLNNFVNSQINGLASQRDQQLNSIANWYANAQNQLKSQIGQAGLNKSTDLSNLSSQLLNQGLSMINQVQQESQNKYNAMMQWAANNSGSLGQLKSNIAAIPQPAPQISFDSSGNLQVPVGYGASSDNTQNQNGQSGLFANASWFQ